MSTEKNILTVPCECSHENLELEYSNGVLWVSIRASKTKKYKAEIVVYDPESITKMSAFMEKVYARHMSENK